MQACLNYVATGYACFLFQVAVAFELDLIVLRLSRPFHISLSDLLLYYCHDLITDLELVVCDECWNVDVDGV